MTEIELYMEAKKTMENAYAPYSSFKVGAAVLTKGGKVYTGTNVENSAYGDSLCAERSALSAAVSAGEREFDAIAVTSVEGWAYPCGSCRQFIFEFGEDIRIIVGKDENHLRMYTISELLPHGFRLNNPERNI